jgi:hypothetical protein
MTEIIDNGPRTVRVITPPCVVCGDKGEYLLDRDAVKRWQDGEHIQHVFTEMVPEEREHLISGTHPSCWTKLMTNMMPKEME